MARMVRFSEGWPHQFEALKEAAVRVEALEVRALPLPPLRQPGYPVLSDDPEVARRQLLRADRVSCELQLDYNLTDAELAEAGLTRDPNSRNWTRGEESP